MPSTKQTIAQFRNAIHLHKFSVEGTNEQIGYVLGCLAREHRVNKKTAVDAETLNRQYAYLKHHYPAHYARMVGFARAYGTTLDDFSYDFSAFGTIPGLQGGCSAVYYPPSTMCRNQGMVSRNLDFPIPYVTGPKSPAFPFQSTYVLELYPKDGIPSLSLFCFEVFGLALEGINAHGLTVIHLADADTRIEHPALAKQRTVCGFNEFLPVQYLLDTCATAQQAMAALRRVDHHHVAIPVHLLVADKAGYAFVFEYAPDGVTKCFVSGSPVAPLSVTNCQLNRLIDEQQKAVVASRAQENGYDRLQQLTEAIEHASVPADVSTIRRINSQVYVHEDMPDQRDRTLYHTIYNLDDRTMAIGLLPTEAKAEASFQTIKLLEFQVPDA